MNVCFLSTWLTLQVNIKFLHIWIVVFLSSQIEDIDIDLNNGIMLGRRKRDSLDLILQQQVMHRTEGHSMSLIFVTPWILLEGEHIIKSAKFSSNAILWNNNTLTVEPSLYALSS